MPQGELPRRRSLRTATPRKEAPSTRSKDTLKPQPLQENRKPRRRRPRTYARKRPSDEVAARSATVALETRNCGEGRVSLGTSAVPLPALLPGGVGGGYAESSDADSSDDDRTYRSRRQARKRTHNKEKEVNEDEDKLQQFMAQQKSFWEEVDDSNLLEQVADDGS